MRVGTGALLAALALGAGGCTRDDPGQLLPGGGTAMCGPTTGSGTTMGTGTGATTGAGGGSAGDAGAPSVLDQRVLDYNEALRTASFKLVGNAPTLQQILDLSSASDKATAYAAMIDALLADARFAARMVAFWQNTMRQGGAASGMQPSRDTAPTFAARIVFEGRPYTDLFTAAQHTCPTFDGKAFADGECKNGPITAGILTDPGIHFQYYGNMAFRRHRFIQEVFVCRAQPAELSAKPVPMGAGQYTSPWPFESIAGTDNGGTIDFHDTSSAICANCHSTSNHRAPLLANFDQNGQYQTSIQVHVPTSGLPLAKMSDWLPSGEPTAWRFGVPAADIGALGAAMAADPEVTSCAVRRMWNYAMSTLFVWRAR